MKNYLSLFTANRNIMLNIKPVYVHACVSCMSVCVCDASNNSMVNKMGQYAHSRNTEPCCVCVCVCVSLWVGESLTILLQACVFVYLSV